jgi:hypothetical protein
MSLLGRTPISIGRAERERRDDRFFVVAAEDTYAPRQYFDGLDFHRVKVVVLPTPPGSGLSSPEKVVERLKEAFQEAKRNRECQEDDEFWVLFDADHHVRDTHLRGTTKALAQAKQVGFEVAISNPCFELWLLLHHEEVPSGQQLSKCAEVEARLNAVLGSYDKTSIKPGVFPIEKVPAAIRRARVMETNPDAPEGRWPESTGTRVYRLLESILKGRPL